MRALKISLAAAVALVFATTAHAQSVIGIATTSGGATEQIATALAKVIGDKATMQVRPQVLANTSQYIPQVGSGKIEFGIANAPQTLYAYLGTGMSAGQKTDSLRLVARLFPFAAGLIAPTKANIKTYADLKGKRVPRFPANSLGDFIIRASLAAGGLTYADAVSVPTANFPRMFDGLKQDKLDVSIATVGSQITLDFEATLGGAKFLTFKKDDEPKVAALLPGTTLRKMPVTRANVGIDADTLVFVYDYTLFTGANVPNELVSRVAKALIDGAADLKASGPLWAEYDVKSLGEDLGMPYHPGAIAAYKAAGILK